MAYQARGQAKILANSTHLVKSLVIIMRILDNEAPSTLRIPISLVRCCAINSAKPNNPRQVMMVAMSTMRPVNCPYMKRERRIGWLRME